MTILSIMSLRKYEPSILVEILLIRDNGINNREVGIYNNHDWGLNFVNNNDTFLCFCDNLKVNVCEIKNFDNGEETGFHCSLRSAFVHVKGKDIFLMDSDTFFFAPISDLFDLLNDCDVVGDKTEWSRNGGRLPLDQGDFIQFNSGVVLLRGDLLQQYGKVVHQYCVEIKNERTNVAKKMAKYEENLNLGKQFKHGREEIAFSSWVIESGLKYKYFDYRDVQTCELHGRVMPRIFHCMTGNWSKYWQRYWSSGIYKHPLRWSGKFLK